MTRKQYTEEFKEQIIKECQEAKRNLSSLKARYSILKDECYSQNEFESFMHVYSVVTDYMEYYNERRRHGSIKFMSPHKFYAAFIDDTVKVKPFTA